MGFDKEAFRNPGKEYRGIPFWSWNDRLTSEEIVWQVDQQEQAGLGGFFCHARTGLVNEYMSKEWMDILSDCVDRSKETGMQVWLYDENGWPSGAADGQVPELGPEYQESWLKFEECTEKTAKADEQTLCIYRKSDGHMMDLAEPLPEGEYVRLFREYNAFYINFMNPRTVEEFIERTHEVYKERFADEFGHGIVGFFTDEPQYGRPHPIWSDNLPDLFKEKYGYDLMPCLPSLYHPVGNYRQVRYDYWSLVALLFHENFNRKIGQWCRDNHLLYTGHCLLEEFLRTQVLSSGSVALFYSEEDMPGMDWLGRRIFNPIPAKQVSSVAEQLGKKRTLTETFALTGYGGSLTDMRWIGEWQYSLGINAMCPHLEGYDWRGRRKRDFPQGFFYQAPWWREWREFNDYFARLGLLLSQGRTYADVLVIHPLKSAFTAMDAGVGETYWSKEMGELDDDFACISELLTGLHFHYHYADEFLFAEHGRAEGKEMVMGNYRYSAAILPSLITIDEYTARQLIAFGKEGGVILACRRMPSLISGGENAALISELAKYTRVIDLEAGQLNAALGAIAKRPVRVLDEQGTEDMKIIAMVKEYDHAVGYYLYNADRECCHDVRLSNMAPGVLHVADCEDGELKLLENSDLIRIPAGGSAYLMNMPSAQAEEICSLAPLQPKTEIVLDGPWRLERVKENSITLDFCEYTLADGVPHEETYFLTLQQRLLDMPYCGPLKLRYTLHCREVPTGALRLAVEEINRYKITINGEEITAKPEGWWCDKSFETVDVTGKLKAGENEILLEIEYYNSPKTLQIYADSQKFEAVANRMVFDTEIEPIYLIGDFGVHFAAFEPGTHVHHVRGKGMPFLGAQPEMLERLELTTQGFAYFAGRAWAANAVAVEKEAGKRYWLDLGDVTAQAVRVKINGTELEKPLIFEPFLAEITDLLTEGENRVELELVSTNRNQIGPFHNSYDDSINTAPWDFPQYEDFRREYSFKEFGAEGVRIICE